MSSAEHQTNLKTCAIFSSVKNRGFWKALSRLIMMVFVTLRDQVTDLLLESVHYKEKKNHFQLNVLTSDINKSKVTLNMWDAALSSNIQIYTRLQTELLTAQFHGRPMWRKFSPINDCRCRPLCLMLHKFVMGGEASTPMTNSSRRLTPWAVAKSLPQ